MNNEENKIIKIQLYHAIMGQQSFEVNSKDHFAELRTLIMENTGMMLFENFRFEYEGKKLLEFQDISQTLHHDAKINLVLEPFDEKSSLHHFDKVKDILARPADWALLNSKQTEEVRDPNIELDTTQISIQHLLYHPLTSTLHSTMIQKPHPTPFLDFIVFSSFNPPPFHRRLLGDFYYIYVRTLEATEYHITACPRGFFINNSQPTHFNPFQSSKRTYVNLLDLLRSISPKFAETFDRFISSFRLNQLDKMILSSLRAPSKSFWITEGPELKKNKTHMWRNSEPERSKEASAIKDWNQILQLHMINLNDPIMDRINKDKYRLKLYQELVEFAKEGAIKVVDGKIPPVHGYSECENQIYVYGSLVYTFIDETPYHYRAPAGGPPTAKMISCELMNLTELDKLKFPELHLRHMVVINYKGFSLVAHTIIPGTHLNRQREKVLDDDKSSIILQSLCKALKLSEHLIYRSGEGEVKKTVCNPGVHIVQGSDKRKYITGLVKLSPRDLNFPGPQNQSCVLRPELIKLYTQKQKCKITINTMIENGYNIVMSQNTKTEEIKLKSMAKFAKEIMLPLCLNSFKYENRKYLADSRSVVQIIHKYGLSSRYLGLLYEKAQKTDAGHLRMVLERVILVKSLKNVFRMAMRQNQKDGLNSLMSHLLNCLFCCKATEQNIINIRAKDAEKEQNEGFITKKKKKKFQKEKQEEDFVIGIKVNKFFTIYPEQFWDIVKKLSEIRYGHRFHEESIEDLYCMKNTFTRIAVLRDLCLCLGLVLEKKQYFERTDELLFYPENILEINALTKHIPIENKHLIDLIEQGDRMTEKCKVQQAIESYNKAIQFMMNNFGNLHDKLALVHKKISNIYFRIGEIDTALIFATNSCRMLEQVVGVTHIETLQNYSLLSLYHFTNRNLKVAKYYMMKMIYLATTSYGEEYPEIIPAYLNLSSIYEADEKFTDSIFCITKALDISFTIFGQFHVSTAVCYAALALLHFQIPDIDQSIRLQEKVVEILGKVLRSDDSRVKESRQILEYYRNLQTNKKIKELHEKQKKKMLNSHLYGTLPLFKLPEGTAREREAITRKMQIFGNRSMPPNCFF